MLAKFNDDFFYKSGVDSKYIFFIQLWKELTDKKTHSSYRYRVCNIFSIIDELREEIELILLGTVEGNRHLSSCIREAVLIFKNDSILLKYYPSICCPLLNAINSKITSECDYRGLQHLLEYSEKKLDNEYLNFTIQDIEQAFEKDDKERIEKLTKNIISICIYKGWSENGLRDLIMILCRNKWNKFKTLLISKNTRKYEVRIVDKIKMKSFKGITIDDGKKAIQLQLKEAGINIIVEEGVSKDPNKKQKNKTVFSVSIDAFDMYSAVVAAVEKFHRVFNEMVFFHYIEQIDFSSTTFFVFDLSTRYKKSIKYNDLYGNRLTTYGSWFLYEACKRTPQEVRKRIGNSIDYYNISLNSNALESKFMNCWVALEAICRTGDYGDIFSHISKVIPDALCLRYALGLYRNFIEDCFRCGIKKDDFLKQIEDDGFNNSKMVEHFILKMENEKFVSNLEKQCECNMLLKYRLEEIKKFSSKDKHLLDKIMQHHDNILWQLSRIYRVRNNIAHNAMKSNNVLNVYVEHLYEYFIDFIDIIIMYAVNNKESNVAVIYKIINSEYYMFDRIVNNKIDVDRNLFLKEFYRTGIINYTSNSNNLLNDNVVEDNGNV